jgi:hypothetical protein
MNNFIINFHSGLAYLVLIGLVIVTVIGIIGLATKKKLNKFDKIIVSATKGFIHLQALAGIILWIVSDKVQNYMQDVPRTMGDSSARRILLEHPLMMLIAVVLITIGGKKISKAASEQVAYKNMFIYGGITLVIILAMIPWDQFMA